MSLPAEEGVIKALTIAGAAKKNGWHGSIDAPLVDGVRVTTIEATRNDEYIRVQYRDGAYIHGEYQLFGRPLNLHCASVALEKVRDWPDIMQLFKWFPQANRPTLVDRYRRLPFEHDEPAETLFPKLYGHQLFWYSHQSAKLIADVMLQPKTKNSDKYRIVDIGHRRLMHFIGQQAGFRSVLLDTIVKVGHS